MKTKQHFVIVAFLTLFTAGCQEPVEELKKSVPKPPSFSEIIGKLKSSTGSILEAFSSGKKGDAHGELHSIRNPLKQLTTIVGAAKLSDDVKATVSGAIEKLSGAVNLLDADLHGQGEANVEEIKTTVTDAISTLESKADLFKVGE